MRIDLKCEFGDVCVNTEKLSENDERICEMIYLTNEEDGTRDEMRVQFNSSEDFLILLETGLDMYNAYFSGDEDSYRTIYIEDTYVRYETYCVNLCDVTEKDANISIHDTSKNERYIFPKYVAELISNAIINEISYKPSVPDKDTCL